MPFSFRKSIKIAPGTRINISRSGLNLSLKAGPFGYSTRNRSKKQNWVGFLINLIFVWPFLLMWYMIKVIIVFYYYLFIGLWIAVKWLFTNRIGRITLGSLSVLSLIATVSSLFSVDNRPYLLQMIIVAVVLFGLAVFGFWEIISKFIITRKKFPGPAGEMVSSLETKDSDMAPPTDETRPEGMA